MGNQRVVAGNRYSILPQWTSQWSRWVGGPPRHIYMSQTNQFMKGEIYHCGKSQYPFQ